jgi:hypothetical protein
MAGRELQDIFPLVPLGNNMNLGIAIVSYNGTLDFGLVGDFSSMPDLDELGDLFAEALEEMGEAAGVRAKAQTPESEADERIARSNGAAPERRFSRETPYEPAPEYREGAETIVMERPILPEEPVEVEEELVESFAEQGAEEAPGPEIEIAEPWDGYAKMTAAQIRERLSSVDTATAGMVEIYERAHKGRKQVIDAAERAQRREPPRTAR